MDRQISYPSALARVEDLLYSGQNAMVALGKLAEAALGTGTSVSGFTCQPTAPASLAISLSAGQVYQVENLEASPISTLSQDTHSVLKQGIVLDATSIALVPPTTPGFAVNVLIEVQYTDTDTDLELVNYENPADLTTPLEGPGGNGQKQPTTRAGAVAIQQKYGTPSTSGTQVTPTPDAGWAPLFVITLSFGQTTITQGSITPYAGAPVVPVNLNTVPAGVQAGRWTYAVDTGTANAYAVALNPIPTALVAGMTIRVRFGSPNTSTSPVINVNGLGNVAILKQGGGAPSIGDISGTMGISYDGAAWRLTAAAPSDTLVVIQTQYLITTNLTFTVYGTGANFTDLAAAFAYLSNYAITQSGSVTLQCAAGLFVHPTPLTLQHPNGSRIFIAGAAMLGAFPTYASLTITGYTPSLRASDNANNLALYRARFATELRFTNGLTNAGMCNIGSNFGNFSNLLFTADGSGSNTDLVRQSTGQLSITNCVFHGAQGRGYGNTTGLVTFSGVIFSGNGGAGAAASGSGNFQMAAGQIQMLSNGADGIDVSSGSSLIVIGATGLYAAGNGGNGFSSNGNSDLYASTIGVATMNGAAGFASAEHGTIHAQTTSSSNNGTYGYYANAAGYMVITSSSASGNGTASTSPAVNTVGNANSYIIQ